MLLAGAVAVAVALGLGLSGADGKRERTLSGGSFTTSIDAHWTVRPHAGARGFEAFAVSSSPKPLDGQGIPGAGAIGITVSESPASALTGLASEARALSAQARAEGAIALLETVVRTPSRALEVAVTRAPRSTSLAGASAAEASYEYEYAGHGSVQVDVVARRAGEIYFVELDTEVARMAQGEAALAGVLRNWRWR